MQSTNERSGFKSINKGYDSVFHTNRLSLGLVVPIEQYAQGPVPTMEQQIERIQLAEKLGFSAVWLRDVPFNVPSFGDAGHLYDPFVYLGVLAGQTKTIALGVASIILPLRHPAHVYKAAASADVLSQGRLILGIASGDRAEEYPALNFPFENRGERFRESFDYIKEMAKSTPSFENTYGSLPGHIDMLPKPTGTDLPLLVTGSSQQSPEWIAQNGDGWMLYPRNAPLQQKIIAEFRTRLKEEGRSEKPVMEPLYIDLSEDPNASPQPIHLGLRLGVNPLRAYLKSRQKIGVNHIALNLRFNQLNIEETLERLAENLLPEFNTENTTDR